MEKTDKKEIKMKASDCHKVLKGTVVSNKMADTVVVLVKRFVKHPKYEKYYTVSKRYQADSKGVELQEGETVAIEECNPISKCKRFKVVAK